MRKILKHVFQIFLYSICTLYSLKISCTSKRERISHDWQCFDEKKIEKDAWKSQIQRHWIHGCWASFSNQNHSSYIYKQTLMPRTQKVALRTNNTLQLFDKKFENWKPNCKVFQGPKSIPIHSWHYQEAIPIEIHSPRTKNW